MVRSGCAIGSRLVGLGSDRVTLRVSTHQADALADALTHLRAAKAEVVRQGDTVEVTSERTVLREATLVAIDDAGERLSRLCTSLLRGEATTAEVRAELEALRGLLDLL
jgi:hypothetical protein